MGWSGTFVCSLGRGDRREDFVASLQFFKPFAQHLTRCCQRAMNFLSGCFHVTRVHRRKVFWMTRNFKSICSFSLFHYQIVGGALRVSYYVGNSYFKPQRSLFDQSGFNTMVVLCPFSSPLFNVTFLSQNSG